MSMIDDAAERLGERFKDGLEKAYKDALENGHAPPDADMEFFVVLVLKDWLESHGYLQVEDDGEGE